MKRCFAVIGFSSAVSLLLLNIISTEYTIAVTVGVAVVFTASLFLPKYRENVVVPLCLGSTLFSCLVFLCVYYSAVQPCELIANKEAAVRFYITDLPQRTDSGYLYLAKTKSIILSGAPQEMKIRIKSETPIDISPYTLIEGKLRFYSLGKTPFSSYGTWGKGVFLTAQNAGVTSTGIVENKLLYGICEMRKEIVDSLCKSVKGDAGALAAAIITGYKGRLSNDTYYAFKTAGVSHIMAVSGLHLTVITGSVRGIFNLFGVKRKISSPVLILFILFYCALTGFAVSVIRAGIMMGVIFAGDLFGRKGDLLNSLGLAVFIICLNPFAPTDAGAVMSVLSVLAFCTAIKEIVKVNEYLKEKRFFKTFFGEALIYILDGLLTSGCVTVFLLPAYYLFFGYCSVIGVFINTFIIPVGSFSTVLSALSCVSVFAFKGVNIFAPLQNIINVFIISVVKMSAALPFSTFVLEKYFGAVIGASLLLFGLCFIINKKRLLKLTAVISIIAFSSCAAAGMIQEKQCAYICITESGAVAVSCNGHTVVTGVKNNSDVYAVKSFIHLKNNTVDVMICSGKDKYTVALSKAVNCKKLIASEFSEEVFENAVCSEYDVLNEYSFSEGGIDFSSKYDGENSLFALTVNGVTAENYIGSEKPDIYIENKTVSDYNGVINLKDGDVIYTVYGNKKYSARRLNLWQS